MKSAKLLLSVSVLLGGILLSQCAPKRDFVDKELLVDVSIMPETWDLLRAVIVDDHDEGEESSARITFYKTNTAYLVRGGETVYRFRSTSRAGRQYWRMESRYYGVSPRHITTWEMPNGFTFSSLSANQWRFVCSDTTFSPTPEFGEVSTVCVYPAQYAEFVVFSPITTKVNDEMMIEIKDVQHFVEAIDQKMVQHLDP